MYLREWWAWQFFLVEEAGFWEEKSNHLTWALTGARVQEGWDTPNFVVFLAVKFFLKHLHVDFPTSELTLEMYLNLLCLSFLICEVETGDSCLSSLPRLW